MPIDQEPPEQPAPPKQQPPPSDHDLRNDAISHAATTLTEYFDSVLILCSASNAGDEQETMFYRRERGNTLANGMLAKLFVKGRLYEIESSQVPGPIDDEEEPPEFDFA